MELVKKQDEGTKLKWPVEDCLKYYTVQVWLPRQMKERHPNIIGGEEWKTEGEWLSRRIKREDAKGKQQQKLSRIKRYRVTLYELQEGPTQLERRSNSLLFEA